MDTSVNGVNEVRFRTVDSLSLPGGQDRNISSIFPHFHVMFLIFLKFSSFSFSQERPGYATGQKCLWSNRSNLEGGLITQIAEDDFKCNESRVEYLMYVL